MIDKNALTGFVQDALKESGVFLVDLTVSPQNDIAIELDSTEGVDIDFCVALTHRIEEQFDRDVEDYNLEVGSAGLTSPFKVKAQYDKNLGNRVEVLTKAGRKLRGELSDASTDTFTVIVEEKVKHEGQKRPVIEQVPVTLRYDEIKYTKYLLEF